jgi:antitoxin (DNA-binding transcriptional repressor) of toxin-antitoxin stability system
MKTISIHDAKTNLSKYIAAVKNGEKVYIGGFGKAEVLLTKVSDEDRNSLKRHNFTVAKGKISGYSNAFSESTEAQVASSLLGE